MKKILSILLAITMLATISFANGILLDVAESASEVISDETTELASIQGYDLVFSDDFSSYEDKTPVVFGGFGPKATNLAIPAENFGTNWKSFAGKFNYLSGEGVRNIRVKTTSFETGNNALHFDGFYASQYIGVKIGNFTPKAETATDNSTGKTFTLVSNAGMNLAVSGDYKFETKAYVPAKLTQMSEQSWRNGSTNYVSTVVVRFQYSDGTNVDKTTVIDSTKNGTWLTLNFDFAITENKKLDYISIFAQIDRSTTTDARGEFYLDDIKLYKKANQATIYLDADKTIPFGEAFNFVAGDKVTLPTYANIETYIPDGKILKGFVIGGVTYAPGAEYTFTENDEDGMAIAPSYDESPVPSYGDLIFFDDFSSYADKTPVVFGGFGPQSTNLPVSGIIGSNWTSYAGKFNYLSGEGVRDIRVKTTSFESGNNALHFDGFYASQYIGVKIGGFTPKAETATDNSTGKTFTLVSNAGMNFDTAGNYRFQAKVYVPAKLTQMSVQSWRNGSTNYVSNVVVRLHYADGTSADKNIAIDSTKQNTWFDITHDFTVTDKAIDYIGVFARIDRSSTTDARGEFYLDEVAFYEVNAEVSFETEDGEVLDTKTYFPGSGITLPGKADIGFEPVFVIDGTEYFAGDVYTTDASVGDFAIVVKALDAPKTLELAQVRTSGVQGLRYAAFVTEAKKTSASEYGFIIALAESFEGNYNELTFDTDKNYVHGTAYDKANGIDIVYSNSGEMFGNKSEGEGYYYTACLVGIPSSEYETDIVGRPYIVINGVTFYGKPIVRNIKEVADAAGVELE